MKEKLYAVYDEHETGMFVGSLKEVAEYLHSNVNTVCSQLSQYKAKHGIENEARINFHGWKTLVRIEV